MLPSPTKWAAQFNAEAKWLMVGALRTLQGWYVAPDWRSSLAWDHHHGRKDVPAVGKPFELSYPGWEVQLLTWPAYSQSLRRSFDGSPWSTGGRRANSLNHGAWSERGGSTARTTERGRQDITKKISHPSAASVAGGSRLDDANRGCAHTRL